eukprot:1148597-Pelagomonas_calceolata.AAC.15
MLAFRSSPGLPPGQPLRPCACSCVCWEWVTEAGRQRGAFGQTERQQAAVTKADVACCPPHAVTRYDTMRSRADNLVPRLQTSKLPILRRQRA